MPGFAQLTVDQGCLPTRHFFDKPIEALGIDQLLFEFLVQLREVQYVQGGGGDELCAKS